MKMCHFTPNYQLRSLRRRLSLPGCMNSNSRLSQPLMTLRTSIISFDTHKGRKTYIRWSVILTLFTSKPMTTLSTSSFRALIKFFITFRSCTRLVPSRRVRMKNDLTSCIVTRGGRSSKTAAGSSCVEWLARSDRTGARRRV